MITVTPETVEGEQWFVARTDPLAKLADGTLITLTGFARSEAQARETMENYIRECEAGQF